MKKTQTSPQPSTSQQWLARSIILLVLLSNLSAALPFLWQPARYAPAFELEGVVGKTLVRSIGLLFLMWIVPYLPAAWNPVEQRSCLLVILVQQMIGLVGESWLWWQLPPGHAALRATGTRFILFDAVGLLLLLIAWYVSARR